MHAFAQYTTTKYLILGGINNQEFTFSVFWRLEGRRSNMPLGLVSSGALLLELNG